MFGCCVFDTQIVRNNIIIILTKDDGGEFLLKKHP